LSTAGSDERTDALQASHAFINAIIPVIEPTEEEELEALRILQINPKLFVVHIAETRPQNGSPATYHQ